MLSNVGMISSYTITNFFKNNLSNKDLHKAKREKNDEFYTQLSDIENELRHYKEHFRNKIVYCNCDTEESNFVKYFKDNFKELELKDFIFSGFRVKGDGDFRSNECIELLKQADIVVTNPPFSLFREYVEQLVEYDKKFIIIGNVNAITYKEIFKLIKENKIWLGVRFNQRVNGKNMTFIVPDHYELRGTEVEVNSDGKKMISVAGTGWFTNLDISKRHEDLKLHKTYKGNENDYPKYDNYNAINIDKTKDIPMDYKGVMGVPINFLDKYNPEQFEIVGSADDKFWYPLVFGKWIGRITIKNKQPFKRIFIKHKKI